MTVAYQPDYPTPALPTIVKKVGKLPTPSRTADAAQVLEIPEIARLRKGPLPHLAEFGRSLPYVFLSLSATAHRSELIQAIFTELARRDYPITATLELFWQLDVRLEPVDFFPALLDFIDHQLTQGALPKDLFEWSVGLLEQQDPQVDLEALRYRLWQHQSREEQNRKTPSPQLIALSGFLLPRASRRHDFSAGLHPGQMRPFLQLLRAVAAIQPIDFPKREDGTAGVRFALDGEVRTVFAPAGDLLPFVAELNGQLHALHLPYQFIFLEKDKKAKKLIPDPERPQPTLTLMNSGTYRQCRDLLPKQVEPRFARSRTGRAEPFLSHVQDLPNLRMNPSLAKKLDRTGTLFG